MNAAYRELELLVARIQKQLAPKSEVIHDARMMGRLTGVERQVDILVRDRIGQYEINIVIDCKDYSQPVDVKGVEEFAGLLNDVGAQKGVLVCPRGFTSTAKTLAQKLQIDLYSPVDTDAHKWQARVTIPAICDLRSALISFRITMGEPYPMRLKPDFHTVTKVYDANDRELGTALVAAAEKWNEGKWPIEPGEHRDLKIFDAEKTRIDNGYEDRLYVRCGVGLTASLLVEQDLNYGQADVTKISGFADHIRGGVIANAFTVGMLDVNDVMNKWQKVGKKEDAAVRPVISIQGLIAWVND